jgi:hypothetical protein
MRPAGQSAPTSPERPRLPRVGLAALELGLVLAVELVQESVSALELAAVVAVLAPELDLVPVVEAVVEDHLA